MDWSNLQNAWGEPDHSNKEVTPNNEWLSPEYLRLLDKLRTGERYWNFQRYADHIPQATIDDALRRGDAVRYGPDAIKASLELLARPQVEEAQRQAPAENLNQPEIETEAEGWGWTEEAQAQTPAEELHQSDSGEGVEAAPESGSIPIEKSAPVQPSPRVFAAQWLRDLLQEQPRWVEDIFRWAKEDGISIATLKRAKKSINAKSVKIGGYFGGEDTRWFWRLG